MALYLEINKISSVTTKEYISLIATFSSTDTKEIDYSRYTKEQIKAMHDQELARFSPKKVLNIIFNKRLKHFVGDYGFIFLAYNQYRKHGTLPFTGSLSEQPNQIMEAFAVLEALMQEQEKQSINKNKIRK